MLIEFIFILKIHFNQSIIYLSMEGKKKKIKQAKNRKTFIASSQTIADAY